MSALAVLVRSGDRLLLLLLRSPATCRWFRRKDLAQARHRYGHRSNCARIWSSTPLLRMRAISVERQRTQHTGMYYLSVPTQTNFRPLGEKECVDLDSLGRTLAGLLC